MKPILVALLCLVANYGMAQQFTTIESDKLSLDMKQVQQRLSEQVASELGKIDWNSVARKTTGGSALFTVPVVVHVVHDYGQELVSDSIIYEFINTISSYFLKSNPDTIGIIDKYKNVAASTQIGFKLATIAPDGSPTKGIEHVSSYLTYGESNQVKIMQWPQDKYLNVWIVSGVIGSSSLGSSYSSLLAAYYPYYDGIVLPYGLLPWGGGAKARSFAKFLNLPAPCGSGCVDGDAIPDTPPCDYFSGTAMCSNIYTAACDTPNVQNIMSNDDNCGLMFTYGQGQYMQYILQIDIGKRDSLITPHNNASTGMSNSMPDLYPVADFSVKRLWGKRCRFFCMGQPVYFQNRSWNDTVIDAAWTFSNAPALSTSSSLSLVTNKFYQPGWVTVSLTATGNNTGSSSITDTRALYVADSIATVGVGYVQEFNAMSMANWPVFNYYNNNFKWQTTGVGYHDNSSMMYTGYDDRPFPQNMTGGPHGDYDDIFTPAFDLTGFGGACYLNFFSSGAVTKPQFINDTLDISYSIDHNNTWVPLKRITKSELLNKGVIATPYTPSAESDWVSHSIAIPSAAQTSFVFFRLSYHPGADTTGKSAGNNFYLDNFNFSLFPEAVGNVELQKESATVFPNPTSHSAKVCLKSHFGINNVMVSVSDFTGKVVYTVSQAKLSSDSEIEIPENALREKGVFIVRIATDANVFTEKLIVY